MDGRCSKKEPQTRKKFKPVPELAMILYSKKSYSQKVKRITKCETSHVMGIFYVFDQKCVNFGVKMWLKFSPKIAVKTQNFQPRRAYTYWSAQFV